MSNVNMYYMFLLLTALYTLTEQNRNQGPSYKSSCNRQRWGRSNGRNSIVKKFLCELREAKENRIGNLEIGRASTSKCCINRMGNCYKYKSYCRSHPIVSKHCPETCNTCNTVEKRFLCELHESKGKSSGIGRAVGSGCCVDRMGNCYKYKSYCRSHQTIRKYCPNTCNACSDTRPAEICKDYHNQCGAAMRNGYCTKNDRNGKWAKSKCKKSCGLCKYNSCKDTHPQCLSASKSGYCKMNDGRGKWARSKCRKSCGICKEVNNAKCGNAPKRCKGKSDPIVSGKEATHGHYPWQVAIYSEDIFLCGGSLISKRHILTAAHCFKGSENKPEILKVILGEHNRDYNIGVEQNVTVKTITIHKHYKPLNTINDIAILVMAEDAMLSDYIQIICLPNKGEVRKVGSQCQVTGWGKQYAGGEPTTLLQEISVPIVAPTKCKRVNNKNSRIVTEKMICTGYYDGYTFKSACHGDSGGPLSCKQNGRWKLFGIVSWGDPTCNALEAFNVFTKVGAYLSWIADNMI